MRRSVGVEDASFDDAWRAMAEPRRRAILQLVASDELAAGEIAAAFDGVTRTAISQHLTVLKHAGLVGERRSGTRRLYHARADGLSRVRDYLDQMWGSSLAAARALVESDRTGSGQRRGHV
jgi:DNA-binding transcriptional ArsR family regulator